jgi:hypothetical protein
MSRRWFILGVAHHQDGTERRDKLRSDEPV